MYLVQYADHDNQTRELSLLSINSFQRGLADNEQLIRALALRVLTSIRVNDILQIQILAVQKCANDKSPYVRKCAANAIAKLHEQSLEAQQKQMLLDIMQKMLSTDTATMVLTSAVITFSEVCPERLDILHTSYRKLCNLLADMDEWGQVVVIDTLARYCRKFFAQPRGTGSAEAIDRTRRVLRTIHGIRAADTSSSVNLPAITSSTGTIPQLPERTGTRKIKRRVVRKGFYSDEEDESTEEEVYADSPGGAALPVATAMRNLANTPNATQPLSSAKDLEDEHLDDDHRLLLRSSLPLLKSRNSAVVLAVCSLHYYCGVASIRVRSSLGKALVRIHRDRREIQYAVLTAIRSLVTECPSAFTPYLQDFFVKGMDPSFTRMIKLDILTSLVLEPASIEAVMKELRTYIRHDDKVFVCAAIRAVGKVAELARIVHDRHGQKSGNVQKERKEANRVSMNALYGLMTLTQASFSDEVVGECAIVMERIILQLMSDSQGLMLVEDSNRIQELTIKRLLLLLTTSLSSRSIDEKASGDHVDDEDEDKGHVKITAKATASALWIVGEWLSSVGSISFHVSGFDDQVKRKTRLELARLVARVFPVMEPVEKMHSIHLATKLLVSATSGSTIDPKEGAVCEMILSMGRAEVNADVRDRARFESNLINCSFGLKYDTENTTVNMGGKSLSTDKVKHIMLHPKPPTSSLPLEDEQNQDCDELSGRFRFGTLSSLVNHRAKSAYLPLPRWASANSPSSLREEKSPNAAAGKRDSSDANNWKVDTEKKTTGFYDSDEESGVEGKLWIENLFLS
jgi:AP-3 complex subunit beta